MRNRQRRSIEHGIGRTVWLFFGIAAVLCCGGSSASVLAQSTARQGVQDRACSDAVHLQAEKESDHIRTWKDLYKYYRTYKRCGFDADAAEGVSESIARLLVDHWDTLVEGAKLAQQERGFREYLLGGVNATVSAKDLELIRTKSESCPAMAASLCGELRKRASSALEDQK